MLSAIKAIALLVAVQTVGAARLETMVYFMCSGCPDGMYGTHLHADTCANNGGGHYNGGDGVTVDDVNENWPVVYCMSGVCSGQASNTWAPAAADLYAGLSIVVHDTPAASSGSGAKMLCADLAGEAGSYSGTFSYLATHPGTYGPISMTRASLRTPGIETEVDFVGSAPDYSMFGAHLHADDCANNGGGHYNGGDGVTVDNINENWPGATCAVRGKKKKNSAGTECEGEASNDWVPPIADLTSGLSIVVHDTPNAASGSGAKMLCADLSPEDLSEDATYSGALSYLSSYGGPGFGEISGDVRLGKANTLQTSISFADSDFGDLVFGAHLHSDTCANNGGGHYNGGDGVTVDAVNENWPQAYCTNGQCSGYASNDWLVPLSDLRSGLSIGSGAKMLCADLAYNQRSGRWEGTFDYLPSYTANNYGSDLRSGKKGMGMGMGAGNFAALWHTEGLTSEQGKGGKGGKDGKGKRRNRREAAAMLSSLMDQTHGAPAVATAAVGVVAVAAVVAAVLWRKNTATTTGPVNGPL